MTFSETVRLVGRCALPSLRMSHRMAREYAEMHDIPRPRLFAALLCVPKTYRELRFLHAWEATRRSATGRRRAYGIPQMLPREASGRTEK